MAAYPWHIAWFSPRRAGALGLMGLSRYVGSLYSSAIQTPVYPQTKWPLPCDVFADRSITSTGSKSRLIRAFVPTKWMYWIFHSNLVTNHLRGWDLWWIDSIALEASHTLLGTQPKSTSIHFSLSGHATANLLSVPVCPDQPWLSRMGRRISTSRTTWWSTSNKSVTKLSVQIDNYMLLRLSQIVYIFTTHQ